MADKSPDLSTSTLRRKFGNRKKLRGSDAYSLGNDLKDKALASGRFLETSIPDVGTLLEALSRFFYQKKHEWVTICLLDSSLTCRLLWVNKGENRAEAEILLPSMDIAELAPLYNGRHVVRGHNHPVSSKDRPDYGSRRANIRASYEHKERLRAFSEQDYLSRAWSKETLSSHDLTFTDVVFSAGTYKLQGHEKVVDAFRTDQTERWQNHPHHGRQECFIAGHVYGTHHPRTEKLRKFRDETLLQTRLGHHFTNAYYAVSPSICGLLEDSPRLTSLVRKSLNLFVGRLLDE